MGKLYNDDDTECPNCHQKNVRLDRIYANKFIRKLVASYWRKPAGSLHDLLYRSEPNKEQAHTEASRTKLPSETKLEHAVVPNYLSRSPEPNLDAQVSPITHNVKKPKSTAIRPMPTVVTSTDCQIKPNIDTGIDTRQTCVCFNQHESTSMSVNPTNGMNPAVLLKSMDQSAHLLSKEEFELDRNWIMSFEKAERSNPITNFDSTVHLSTPSHHHASLPSIVPFISVMPAPSPVPLAYPVLTHDNSQIGSSSISRRNDSYANDSKFHRSSDMRRTSKSPFNYGHIGRQHYPHRSSKERIYCGAKKHIDYSYRRGSRSINNQYYGKRYDDSDKTNDLRTSYRKDSPSNESHMSQVRSNIHHTSISMSGECSFPQQFRGKSRSTGHHKPLDKLDRRRNHTRDRSVSIMKDKHEKSLRTSMEMSGGDIDRRKLTRKKHKKHCFHKSAKKSKTSGDKLHRQEKGIRKLRKEEENNTDTDRVCQEDKNRLEVNWDTGAVKAML